MVVRQVALFVFHTVSLLKFMSQSQLRRHGLSHHMNNWHHLNSLSSMALVFVALRLS
jgi:hypothetical protein